MTKESDVPVGQEQPLLPKGVIKAVWESKDENDPPTQLTLYIPEVDEVGVGAFFNAELIDYEDEGMGKTLRAGTLGVDARLRAMGYGKRLVQALGCIGIERGCDEIEVDFGHPASLIHFVDVYGPERIQLLSDTERVSWGTQETITEINLRRAGRARVVTADGRSHVDLDRVGISGVIDLKGLNIVGWVVPVIQDASQAPWNIEQ